MQRYCSAQRGCHLVSLYLHWQTHTELCFAMMRYCLACDGDLSNRLYAKCL